MAFHAAAEADPNALLVYNDWGVEFDTSYQDARRKSILKLLERLKSQGVPVDAFGMQSHVRYDTNFNSKKLQNFLADVADLGLKILVTQMDVSDKNLPKDVNTRDRMIAGVYEDFLSVVLAEPAVIAVITWGLSDKHTWLSWNAPRQDGASVRPLPLDAQLNRKLAWNAIARAFDRAPKRRTSMLSNAWKNLY
jgi:endo-1,4-beta-xylanase